MNFSMMAFGLSALASSDDPNGIMETFIEGTLPKPELYEGQNPNDNDKPLF